MMIEKNNNQIKGLHNILYNRDMREMVSRQIIIMVFSLLLFSGFQAISQDTIVSVRFWNPEYVCTTQTFSLDVEFQCNIPDKQLYGMNVRFVYPEDVLEFTSFGEFVTGYGKSGTPAVSTGSPNSGMERFGFPGAYEFVNGVVQKKYSSGPTLPTSGWLKLFNINFHVDDPEALNDPTFCPSVIWDLKESPAAGGFISSGGVVITLVYVYPDKTTSTIENVVHFNWQYNDDGDPYNPPFGSPVSTNCISTQRTYAPSTSLPFCEADAQGLINIPVTVTNFNHVGHFSLVFEYDPTVITYVNNTPNAIFTDQNGLLNVTDSASTNGKNKITMAFQGTHTISLNDGDHVTDLHFTYLSGITGLNWKTTNNSCHYVDTNNIPKCDLPYSDYYHCGTLAPVPAPITKIDSNVAITGDFVTFAVRVWNFSNIRSGLLTLDYDPDTLVYYEAVPNAAFTSTFEDNVLYEGRLEMGWTGNDTSLTDGSVIAYLTFEYLGGAAPLLWFDNGSSCQYVNCNFLALYDEPSEFFYINGNVTNAEFVWTGDISNDWSTSENWLHNIVPDPFTNVTIDPSTNPLYWPTFYGDFNLGEDCMNLTLKENAEFSVLGDLTINPGHTLNFNGSGVVYVDGNWTNSGIFNPGEGSVEFTGSEAAYITEGVPPGNYVAAYLLSTFTAGMTPITEGSALPPGDNAHGDVSIGFVFNYLGINYSMVRININGWLSLNLSGDDMTSNDNTTLFNTSLPTTVLAPWWDDLKADGSTVAYITEGTAPYRVFTAEWKNILAYSTGATTRLNFQIKLYETTNNIEFCYGNLISGTHNDSESASIGIKDATGGPGKFREATHNSTHLILPFLKSEVNWPTVNYRFSPPVYNEIDIFHEINISKVPGTLYIQRDVHVTGIN